MKALEPKSVDFTILENAKQHHTDKYELIHLEENPIPVLRRGAPFEISVKFDRPFNNVKDEIRFFFRFMLIHKDSKIWQNIGGTLLKKDVSALPDPEEETDFQWAVAIKSQDGNTVTFEVVSSAEIAFGRWKLAIKTSLIEFKTINYSYKDNQEFYMLFNPWCSADDVFMPTTKLLDEYVLNDIGKIYIGKYQNIRSRSWEFGQFDGTVLPMIIDLIEPSALTYKDMTNPIKLSRTLSNLVGEILEGRWDTGNYEGGTSPTLWTGSVPIITEWVTLNHNAEEPELVKYGQCWCFGGLLNTVCRAIGLPSRVITNFSSAHDYNGNFTIDKFYPKPDDDEDLGFLEDDTWSFHVWNDVWMARHDLPPGYGGWQAVDATKQEKSDGFYRCGPASVVAIKQGKINLDYDVQFVMSEVNADVCHWKIIDYDECKLVHVDTQKISPIILTKQPFIFDPNGNSDFEDITHHYKYSEGSPEERLAFKNAFYTDVGFKPEEHHIDCKLLDFEDVNIGNDFKASVSMKNDTDESKTIEVILAATSMYYNGVKVKDIGRKTDIITIDSKATVIFDFVIKPEEYLPKLTDYALVKIYATTKEKETDYTWADEDFFIFNIPIITISADDDLAIGKTSKLKFSFQNPLKIPLTNCKFVYQGTGIAKNQNEPVRDILAEESVNFEFDITPTKPGNVSVIVTFYSNELKNLHGTEKLIIA